MNRAWACVNDSMDLLTVRTPLITQDIVVFGLLVVIAAVVQLTSTSQNRILKKFYFFCPPLMVMYFLPGILNTTNVIDGTDFALLQIANGRVE